MLDTTTLWYLAGLIATIPLSIARYRLVYDFMDQAVFNVLASSLLHIIFVGFLSYLHVVVMVTYTMVGKGRLKTPVFLALIFTHLTYINWSYDNVTTAIHMMCTLRAHYYFIDTTSNASKESVGEDVLAYMFNPVGYFTGPIIPFDTYYNLAVTIGTTKPEPQMDSQLLIKVFQYSLIYFLGSQTIDLAATPYSKLVFTLPLNLFVLRTRYYAIWELSRFIAQLYGYPDHLAVNIRPSAIENATSIREIVSNWNISTHLYLKNAVYKPMLASGIPASMAKFATFLISGLWHGISWRYIMSFVGLGAFVTTFPAPFKYPFFDNVNATRNVQALVRLCSYIYLNVMLGAIMLPMTAPTMESYLVVSLPIISCCIMIQLCHTHWPKHFFQTKVDDSKKKQ